MIARNLAFPFIAVLITACSDPIAMVKEPSEDAAFAKGGSSGITAVLLPTLGGFGDARAVNDGGVVVGTSSDNTGASFAVRWTRTTSGSWGVASIAGPGAQAFAVNANGTVVGVRAGRAKLWPAGGGAEIDLGPGSPAGINSAETVVGYRIDPILGETAVVWRRPAAGWNTPGENASQDLPAYSGGTGQSQAFAINEAGIISGVVGVTTATSSYYAVRWDPAGDQWTAPAALSGAESRRSTTARAINDNLQPDFAGHVTPCATTPCSSVGIFWPEGNSPTNLEPLFAGGSGWVDGLNNAHRGVGFRFDPRHGDRAFVWSPGQTSLQLLPSPGRYSNTIAYDINNANPAQAVGTGRSMRGSSAIVWAIP